MPHRGGHRFEWLERVVILDQGVAWNGETYGSLSQVAKAMTGTIVFCHAGVSLLHLGRRGSRGARAKSATPDIGSA
jgi:hypothetical protein